MSDLGGGAKCIKYTLFIFNMLFLLAGLALIIVGAVAQVQANKNLGGGSLSGAGIFIIVIGGIVFVICFFGCAGAINNNYCMVVTYGVLLVLLLVAEVAGVIAGFVLKNQIQSTLNQQLTDSQKQYNFSPNDVTSGSWNNTQSTLKCCGTTGYQSWGVNQACNSTNTVPDTCCVNYTVNCGVNSLTSPAAPQIFYTQGCTTALTTLLKTYLVAVGAVAAAIAILEVIGIIFAFCLAHSLRKDYRVV